MMFKINYKYTSIKKNLKLSIKKPLKAAFLLIVISKIIVL